MVDLRSELKVGEHELEITGFRVYKSDGIIFRLEMTVLKSTTMPVGELVMWWQRFGESMGSSSIAAAASSIRALAVAVAKYESLKTYIDIFLENPTPVRTVQLGEMNRAKVRVDVVELRNYRHARFTPYEESKPADKLLDEVDKLLDAQRQALKLGFEMVKELFPPIVNRDPKEPSLHEVADRALRLLCNLNLQDHSKKEQTEARDVVHALLKLLKPERYGK